MTENQLIGKIREFRQIKPSQDWVILTKRRILGEKSSLAKLFLESFRFFPNVFFQYKLALVTFVFVLIATFAFAQKSLPGEPLFLLKKIAERSRAVFVSEIEQPKAQLELANKRLEELAKIAEANQVKKLAPAISEFKASVSDAAQKLSKIKGPQKTRGAGKALIAEIKKLEENKENIESLGVVIGDTQEIEDAFCQLTEREIENLGTLTEKQEEILKEAEIYLEDGKCSLAFEKILYLSYPQE